MTELIDGVSQEEIAAQRADAMIPEGEDALRDALIDVVRAFCEDRKQCDFDDPRQIAAMINRIKDRGETLAQ